MVFAEQERFASVYLLNAKTRRSWEVALSSGLLLLRRALTLPNYSHALCSPQQTLLGGLKWIQQEGATIPVFPPLQSKQMQFLVQR